MAKTSLGRQNQGAIGIVIVIVMIVVGIGTGLTAGYFMIGNGGNQTNTVTTSAAGVYQLDLVEIMDVSYNSSAGAQPMFYVVQNGSLTSSANIFLPSNTRIVVTIISYDMGNASVPSQYLSVTGTVGNEVSVISGMIASGANTSSQWSHNVSEFSASEVLHTFTILNGTSVLLNIPVVAGDTEMATFYLNSTGTFTWQCEAACGTGPYGWGGPMSTSGWMEGSVTVH